MLTLTIKKKWFDMIASGEKKEEYRALSDYYDVRFSNAPRFFENGKWVFYLVLRAGYQKSSPRLTICCWLDVGKGKPEWGAEPGKDYFILHIIWRGKLEI